VNLMYPVGPCGTGLDHNNTLFQLPALVRLLPNAGSVRRSERRAHGFGAERRAVREALAGGLGAADAVT